MKTIVKKYVLVLVLWMLGMSTAHAFFYSYGGEEITKVLDLPDTDEYSIGTGQYVDIGYIYSTFSIIGIPLYNYNGRLIGDINSDSEYLELSENEINELVADSGLSLPSGPYLSFWQRIGGKLTFVLVLILFIMYQSSKRRTSETSEIDEIPLEDGAQSKDENPR